MSLAEWLGPEKWRSELPHSSSSHVFLWITRGQGRCVIEGIRHGLGVHNAVCIPAKTLFALDIGRQCFGTVCLIPTGSPILMPDQQMILRIRDVRVQGELTAILEAMQQESGKKHAFVDESLQAYASLLTIWLRRAMIDGPEESVAYSAAQRLVIAFAALIERDFASGKTMSEYARLLGVTPTHLTRICRSCSGLTASELLTQRIVHASREFLAKTNHPANQIAAMLGFKSAAYFSRFVLRHTGHSPSALRA